MSYSNDQVQIRQGLVSYIGALIKSSSFEGKAARQNAASILIEEALKLAQNDNELDFYVLKPLLRGNVFALNHRINELSKLPASPEVKNTIENYKSIVAHLEQLVKSIK
ncbi:hypothetical protein [Heyndrickxia sporothermodurans]|uniref:hypothetical protein n=1 Tax=Heyndrickxia sporothermodurans TaxID=46224 RepID=UPI000D3C5A36|nr:hypothetical protein [Heyndrickxia sporothermodurans]PTY92986.1 hypothetical protein B5V90_02585 [Heyndrickxia sporothermodurans]